MLLSGRVFFRAFGREFKDDFQDARFIDNLGRNPNLVVVFQALLIGKA